MTMTTATAENQSRAEELSKHFKAVFVQWSRTSSMALSDTCTLRAELATLCSSVMDSEDIEIVIDAVDASGWQQAAPMQWTMIQYKAYNQAVAAFIARSQQLLRSISPIDPEICSEMMQVSAEFGAPRCLSWSLRRRTKVQAARAQEQAATVADPAVAEVACGPAEHTAVHTASAEVACGYAAENTAEIADIDDVLTAAAATGGFTAARVAADDAVHTSSEQQQQQHNRQEVLRIYEDCEVAHDAINKAIWATLQGISDGDPRDAQMAAAAA